MNAFYDQNKYIQWAVALFLGLVFLGLIVWWTLLCSKNFLAYPLLFLLMPAFQFSVTPLMRLTGVYAYLSPMLLVYAPTAKKYDLHNGTSFDYLFVLRKTKPGTAMRTAILKHYLAGLLEIVNRIEAGQLEEGVTVRGSSYFFSKSTAERMGFSLGKSASYEQLNIVINYLDLVWMYSLAHGKLLFPKLNAIKQATIKGTALVQQKEKMTQLLNYLEKRESRP